MITDEFGHVLKKYDDNMQEILLLKNKIEILDNKLNKDFREQERVVYLSKQM